MRNGAMIRFHCCVPASVAGNLDEAILFKPRFTFSLKTRRYLAEVVRAVSAPISFDLK
jgi:hypothetical protein